MAMHALKMRAPIKLEDLSVSFSKADMAGTTIKLFINLGLTVSDGLPIPFLKTAFHIVNGLIQLLKDVDASNEYLQKALKLVKSTKKTLDRLSEASFPESNNAFQDILETLATLEQLCRRWAGFSPYKRYAGFSIKSGSSYATKFQSEFQRSFTSLSESLSDLQQSVTVEIYAGMRDILHEISAERDELRREMIALNPAMANELVDIKALRELMRSDAAEGFLRTNESVQHIDSLELMVVDLLKDTSQTAQALQGKITAVVAEKVKCLASLNGVDAAERRDMTETLLRDLLPAIIKRRQINVRPEFLSAAGEITVNSVQCAIDVGVDVIKHEMSRFEDRVMAELAEIKATQVSRGSSSTLEVSEISLEDAVMFQGRFGPVHKGELIFRGTSRISEITIEIIKLEDGAAVAAVEQERKILSTLKHCRLVNFIGTARNDVSREVWACRETCELGSLDHILALFQNDDAAISPLLKELGTDSVFEARGVYISRLGSALPGCGSALFRIAKDVTSAVHYLHEQMIVHNALTTKSVLIDRHGRARVAHFDQAINLRDASAVSSANQLILGRYLAAEVLKGQPPDFNSDIFSLAFILRCLLTGDEPFSNETNAMIIAQKIICGERPSLPLDFTGPMAKVIRLLKRMWSQEPTSRPGAGAILHDLAEIESSMVLMHAVVRPKVANFLSATDSSTWPPIVKRKLENPQITLKLEDSIEVLVTCTRIGEERAAKAKGRNVLMVIGNTGAGKSTFINYACGCLMTRQVFHFVDCIYQKIFNSLFFLRNYQAPKEALSSFRPTLRDHPL